MGNEYDAILTSSEMVARSEEKWMSIYRCRECATFWAEACYDRGHVFFYYLFPAPPFADPARWLREDATELPSSL